MGGNLVERRLERRGQNNGHESIRMAFCSRHLEGRGQVYTTERHHDCLETWGSKNRVHAKQENRKVREYQVHTALCLSLLMADPSPPLCMYMAHCWPYPRPLFLSGTEQCKEWRWEERLLLRPWFPWDPALNLGCIFFSHFNVYFFFNKEKSKFYMCVLHTCTCLNMSIYIAVTCGYHDSSYHLSHIYPSLTKRINE